MVKWPTQTPFKQFFLLPKSQDHQGRSGKKTLEFIISMLWQLIRFSSQVASRWPYQTISHQESSPNATLSMEKFQAAFTFSKNKIVNHFLHLKILHKPRKDSRKRVGIRLVRFQILAFIRCAVAVHTATTFRSGGNSKQLPPNPK